VSAFADLTTRGRALDVEPSFGASGGLFFSPGYAVGNAGASIRAVHSWQPIGDYSLVLATGKGSKLADVAGKTFASSGPGGLPDQLPRLIMRKHGIDETTARFVQVGGHAARLQAVIGGRADATLVNTVTALKGVKDGKVTVVARLSAEFPGLGYVWNVVRTEALAKPELAAAFQTMTDIGIRGSRFVMANPDEAAAILHERRRRDSRRMRCRRARSMSRSAALQRPRPPRPRARA